jgi:hypothetical protein
MLQFRFRQPEVQARRRRRTPAAAGIVWKQLLKVAESVVPEGAAAAAARERVGLAGAVV